MKLMEEKGKRFFNERTKTAFHTDPRVDLLHIAISFPSKMWWQIEHPA